MRLYDYAMTPSQCRAGRGLIGWSQDQLAEAASVSVTTIRNFERGASAPIRATLSAIQSALEVAGVVFIDENGGGAGVRSRQAVVRLLSRRYDDGRMAVVFRLAYIGQEITGIAKRAFLSDWDQEKYSDRQQCEAAFDNHEADILARSQDLIDQGRAKNGKLVLELRDFTGE